MSQTVYHGTILKNIITCLSKEESLILYDRSQSDILNGKEFYVHSNFDVAVMMGLRTSCYFNSPLMVLSGTKLAEQTLQIEKMWWDRAMNIFASFPELRRLDVSFVSSRLMQGDLSLLFECDLAEIQRDYEKNLRFCGNYCEDAKNPYL